MSSFFRSLNPTSKRSGIFYSLAFNKPCQYKEMIDSTVSENICAALNKDLNYFEGLVETFNIFTGSHYDLSLRGSNDCKGGAKGVLDYLIIPLLARKIVAETYRHPYFDRCLQSRRELLTQFIFAPIEIARFCTAFAFTILLAPVVALVHLIKGLLSANDKHAACPSLSSMKF